MPNRYSKFIPFISIAGDLLLLNLLFVAGFCYIAKDVRCFETPYIAFYAYLNLVWLILEISFGAHNFERNTRKSWLFFTYIKIIVFFFFLFLLFFQAYPLQYYPRTYIKYLFPIFFFLVLAWKFSLFYAFYFYRKLGFNYRTVIIIGYSPRAEQLSSFLIHNKWHGYRFLGFFDESATGPHVLGNIRDLPAYFEKQVVDEVYIGWNGIPKEQMEEITDIVTAYPVKVRIVPDLGNFSYKAAELVDYGSLPVIQIHQGPLEFWYNKMIKRAFDVAVSLVVILGVLSWMTVVLYVISLFGSRQGLFFRQQRTRADGKIFWCLKFRTMYKNPQENLEQAVENDPRVTPVGKYLRKLSLDEIPQFINVLLGQMSVVGPRPHMLKHTEEYRKLIRSFMLRHTVKPGITGLAQVSGYRGEIKVYDDLKNRVECDVKYIENWTFNMDIKILFLTAWVMLRGQKEAY